MATLPSSNLMFTINGPNRTNVRKKQAMLASAKRIIPQPLLCSVKNEKLGLTIVKNPLALAAFGQQPAPRDELSPI
ncbi:hypothetical protein SE18_11650 [Herpetosiphon geysericola]|uniref:Uncharacterized protein n=1 Tax=Herpetosiphon geysericola TaxID=70996 RepID=A0A0P6XTL6_9CHLR|nr:hypothetical protein SE18_11650 [Herpetosiphon geysericola]